MLKVGHRGAKAHEPENTLRSFRKGIRMGANAIEFDTHVSKDGVPVVIHDHTLERTTNGKGSVHDKTLKELRALDAGKGEKIPTVRETLLLLKSKKVTALVEIKDKAHVKELVKVVKRSGMGSKVIMHSYSTDALKAVNKIDPKIKTGLIFQNKIKNVQGFMRLGKVIKADWFFGRKDALPKTLIDTMHKWKFKVNVWVCNTKTDIAKFEKQGADAIASDKPDLFRK